jgi:dienelactone hydrolase
LTQRKERRARQRSARRCELASRLGQSERRPNPHHAHLDWTPAEDCRKLAAGQNDLGISTQKGEGSPIQLIVYPGAYHAFDIPTLHRPINYFGHRMEFNQSVTDQSSEALHKFFQSVIDNRP